MRRNEPAGRARAQRLRGERGTTTVMLTGFCVVLLMLAVVIIDASAAYQQRQGLANLADGAALYGVDQGIDESELYDEGIDGGMDAAAVQAAVDEYLAQSDAYNRFPGLSADADVQEDRVVVEIQAPLDLPLTFPGLTDGVEVGADGAALVTLNQ